MAKQTQNPNRYSATVERIKELKAKHGTVHVIKVRKDDESIECVLKDPYAPDLGLKVVSAAYAEKDVIKRNLFLLDNLWIEGDDAFKNDNLIRLTGATEASGLVTVLEAETVKH